MRLPRMIRADLQNARLAPCQRTKFYELLLGELALPARVVSRSSSTPVSSLSPASRETGSASVSLMCTRTFCVEPTSVTAIANKPSGIGSTSWC